MYNDMISLHNRLRISFFWRHTFRLHRLNRFQVPTVRESHEPLWSRGTFTTRCHHSHAIAATFIFRWRWYFLKNVVPNMRPFSGRLELLCCWHTERIDHSGRFLWASRRIQRSWVKDMWLCFPVQANWSCIHCGWLGLFLSHWAMANWKG